MRIVCCSSIRFIICMSCVVTSVCRGAGGGITVPSFSGGVLGVGARGGVTRGGNCWIVVIFCLLWLVNRESLYVLTFFGVVCSSAKQMLIFALRLYCAKLYLSSSSCCPLIAVLKSCCNLAWIFVDMQINLSSVSLSGTIMRYNSHNFKMCSSTSFLNLSWKMMRYFPSVLV